MPASAEAQRGQDGNLWEDLLRRVGSGGGDLQSSTVVVLGDPGAGKRTLANKLLQAEARARLRRADVPATQIDEEAAEAVRARGVSMAALGYTYLNPPVDPEPPIKVNVWVVEGTDAEGPGLATAIPDPAALRSTVAVLVVDLSRPWEALASLRKWHAALQSHFDGLGGASPEQQGGGGSGSGSSSSSSTISADGDLASVRDALRRRTARYLSAVKLAGGDQSKFNALFNVDASESAEAKADDADLPVAPDQLPPKCLGIPLVVVGSKSDVVREASDDVDTELRLEFIQRNLRQFCLEAGASLTYVSSRLDASSLSLLQYLVHVISPQAPAITAKADEQTRDGLFAPLSLVSKRDVVHVPAGADHAELLGALAGTKQSGIVDWSASDRFEDVIKPPASASAATDESGPHVADAAASEEEPVLPHASFLAKLLARQKLLPEASSGRAAKTDAASSALEAFNAAAASIKPGIVSAATPVKRAAADASAADASEPSTSAEDPGSARRVTAQDAKENPALIANFFQNLLNRDKEKDKDAST